MWRSITTPNSSRTAATYFLLTEVFFEISLRISVLVYLFFIAGALRGGAALTFIFGATFFGELLTAMPDLLSHSSVNLFGLRELLGLCPTTLHSF